MKDSISAYSKEKSLVKKSLKNAGFEDIVINNGYYYFSGFAKKNEKVIYFSIFDVRNFKGELMIRKAKDYKDFSGGTNNFCKLEQKEIEKLANSLAN